MSKGAIPVPYIIALILGIVVVGILGYGFFVLGWQLPGLTKEQQCNSKVNTFCQQWLSCTFGSSCKPSDDWNSYAPGCQDVNVNIPSESDCRRITGAKYGLGHSCTDDTECASIKCAASGVCIRTDAKGLGGICSDDWGCLSVSCDTTTGKCI